MKKKTVKWAVFLVLLLAVGIYTQPMPLSKVLPVDEAQQLDFLLAVPYTVPMGDSGGRWIKEYEYMPMDKSDSATAQALSDVLETVGCRRSLNPFAGKPVRSAGHGSMVITLYSGTDRWDFDMVSYKKAARIYHGHSYAAYVLEAGAYDQIAAVLKTYGSLQEE